MAFHRGPKIVTDGLVVYLDAANQKSYPGEGNIWDSLVSDTRSIIQNGATFQNDYISFDGIDDYAYFENEYSFITNTDYTLEIWFKMRELPVVSRSNNSHVWGGEINNDVVMYLWPESGGVSKGVIVYDDSSYNVDMSTIGGFQANTWAQWIVTGNGTNNTVTHYINGQLDSGPSPVLETQLNKAWSGIRFAYDSRWGNYSKLDVAIARQYNRELSADEVLKNFDAQKSRFGL